MFSMIGFAQNSELTEIIAVLQKVRSAAYCVNLGSVKKNEEAVNAALVTINTSIPTRLVSITTDGNGSMMHGNRICVVFNTLN